MAPSFVSAAHEGHSIDIIRHASTRLLGIVVNQDQIEGQTGQQAWQIGGYTPQTFVGNRIVVAAERITLVVVPGTTSSSSHDGAKMKERVRIHGVGGSELVGGL